MLEASDPGIKHSFVNLTTHLCLVVEFKNEQSCISILVRGVVLKAKFHVYLLILLLRTCEVPG